jgi:tetratricopeptide (TPR) repeat protein
MDVARPPEPPYAALFREYIQRGAQATLTAVRSAGPALPVEQREQSLHTLEFALDLPEAWPEARELLLALAPRLEQAGFRQGYLPFLRRGIEQCRAAGDLAGQAEMELHLGLLLLVMGSMEEARGLFMGSAQRFQAVGDQHKEARALNRWAYIDRLQQRPESAERLVAQAMGLVGPEDTEATYGQFVLGCLAIDRHDWPQALSYLRQALDEWQRHGEPGMVARSLTNLGSAQRGAGEHQEAIASFHQAITLMRELGDIANEAATRMNLGNVYRELGQLDQALAQYRQAEQVFRQTEDHLRLSRVHLNTGQVYKTTGQWQQAHAAFSAAIDFYRMLGDRRGAANALDALAEVHLLQGEYGAALPVLEQAQAEMAGLEGRPGYASLFADIEQHLAEARQGLGYEP